MAGKKKKGKSKPQGGGSLMGMRSGLQRMAGQGKKKKSKDATFNQVFGWVLGIALAIALVWAFTR